jgi:hypothetical protein
VIHRLALYQLSAAVWPSVPLVCVLLHETSTAAPMVGDQFLADLDLDVNELVNDDYERQAVGGRTTTWNVTSGRYDLEAATVTFEALTPAHVGQGVSCVIWAADTGDDATSPIVRSELVLNGDGDPTVTELTGGDIVVPWGPAPLTIGNPAP